MFLDRSDAGRQLAGRLAGYRAKDPVVVGLPCAGVAVAFEVASALGAPMDLLVVRTLRAPQGPRIAIGAIAEGGECVIDPATTRELALGDDEVEALISREKADVDRWATRFRGTRAMRSVRGCTAILVDDGATTGRRAALAGRMLRRLEPARLVVALPVVASAAIDSLRASFDDLVYLDAPPEFIAVGYWYARGCVTSDDDVSTFLDRSRQSGPQLEPTPRAR